ncbi:anti sigma factor C-terminal domain-containing protein [Lysinibacillus sp. NPDC096418]|uniref:anti sigma factor C-terminal domain-containing protein n=1 Tax=Lysinibacillus sp. NPDC096418 TaxID=3364138 RepID=UPI00380D535E
MEDLFNKEKMEKTIKKAKRCGTWKTVLITFTVLVVTVISGLMINNSVRRNLEMPVRLSFEHFQEIAGANEFIGVTKYYPGILGGENHYKTFKYIEGKVVPTGEGAYGYGFLRNEKLNTGQESPIVFTASHSETDLEYQHYNDFGQREMLFFYPFLQYKETHNDLAFLPEIGDDKIMEVALSFDKGYKVDEALSIIPKEVTATWLWVKDVNETDDFTIKSYSNEGEVDGTINLLRSEHTVYGFSLLTFNGNPADQPAEQFVDSIKDGKDYRTRWQGEFKRLEKVIGGEDELSADDIVIYGAVVTGNKVTLASLQNLDFIKASSLGAITDKY